MKTVPAELRPFLRFAILFLVLGAAAAAAILWRSAPPTTLLSGTEPEVRTTAKPSPSRVDARLGEGFVIWESNRSGKWRIWRRELNGSGLRQLTPQQGDLNHCCAHISHDGRWIAYLRYRPGQRREGREPPKAAVHLMRADGSDDRVLVEEVRLLSESRAVVWRSPEELLYVDAQGHTELLDLTTGGARQLTIQPHPKDGWLMNRTLSHATTGWVTFSPYDAKRRVISEQRVYGGCQPYFSDDGRWGFWEAGAGGPINKIDLATRRVSTILAKNDARMPEGQGYLYFPMLSRCGQLFAFSASPNEHDFTKSNYDIFVAETDPRTVELLGEPVQLTFDEATDRFPDVFLTPHALGRHFGEAPFRVLLATEEVEGSWQWDYGDGGREASTRGEHVFRRAGSFEVRAQQGDRVLRGRVRVEPAQPPHVVTVSVEGDRRIRVTFDEEVELGAAELRLGSGSALAGWEGSDDRRSLLISLEHPVTREDRLHLAGVVDRAQQPNRMPATKVVIEAPTWPSRREGLVFLWQSADAPNLVHDPKLDTDRTYTLQPRGRARLDRHYAMRLGGGSFVAGDEAAENLAAAIRGTNRLTLEARLTPEGLATDGPADVIAFSGRRPERENFTLYRENQVLFLSLRGSSANLARLTPGAHHLIVTYTPGQLRTYLDGELVVESEELQGDFFHWKKRPLTFGSGPRGGRDWAGSLEGIAIYSRLLEHAEVRENARRYREKVESRAAAPRLRVAATLRDRSRIPTLDEIAPYREALVVYEYEAVRVLEGAYDAQTIRVAHWAILDGETLPLIRHQPGRRQELVLEPFATNPQLESLYISETLPPRDELELYYDLE